MLQIPLRAVLIAATIHALWGGNPIAAKFGLVVFPPFSSAFIRFILGILVVVLWARYQRIPILPSLREWPALLAIGLLFTVQIAFMNIGIDNTSGIIAAVLISTNPLFAALFAHYMIAGDKLTLRRTLGLLVAFSGVCLTLLNPQNIQQTDLLNIGIWISVASAVLLGFRMVISANVLKSIEPARVAIWQMVISLPIYAALSWRLETIHWEKFNTAAALGLMYQGFIVAGLGFTVSFWLMLHYRPSIMMSFNFVAPVTGVLLAGWLLGEEITRLVVFGVALVALGLVLITRRDREEL